MCFVKFCIKNYKKYPALHVRSFVPRARARRFGPGFLAQAWSCDDEIANVVGNGSMTDGCGLFN